MQTSSPPAVIHAHVHQDAIKRVSRFFNATTKDTLAELFQNCRRSGASRVDVKLSEHRITVTDDGAGLADPSVLLAFGRTGWDADTAEKDDAAGMGVFALAQHTDVVIESRVRPTSCNTDGQQRAAAPRWRVRLTPDHFSGKAGAQVALIDDADAPFGTSVTFKPKDMSNPDLAETAASPEMRTMHYLRSVEDAALYFPLPVRFNNNPVEQKNFLEGALYTRTWRGVRIGVYKQTPACRMNMHGIVITAVGVLPTIHDYWNGIERSWSAAVDIENCPGLELILPARRDVVRTDFLNELQNACRETIFRAMAAQQPPIEVPKRVQSDAAAFGIGLSIPSPKLLRWRPGFVSEYSRKTRPLPEPFRADALIVETDLSVSDQHTLQRAAQLTGLADRLFAEDTSLDGCEWYDNLARVTSASASLTNRGTTTTLHELRNENSPKQAREKIRKVFGTPLDEINFTLTVTNARGDTVPMKIPADVIFFEEEECWPEDLHVFVTRKSSITAEDLAVLIHKAYFSFSDWLGADSYDTQSYNHLSAARSRANAALLSAEDAQTANLSQAVKEYVMPWVEDDQIIEILVSKTGPTEIAIKATNV